MNIEKVRYNLMVAHSGDTSKYVNTVKDAVRFFCAEYEKYNENGVDFDVKDYNDATFSTYSEKTTQTIVFEQFAGHADLIIALIGKRIGDGLREELSAAKKEKKQVFVYLDSSGIVYDVFNPDGDNAKLEQDVKNAREIAKEFANTGYANPFFDETQLKKHIVNDLARFLKHRRSIDYELKDKTYREFTLKEVDRYRDEIGSVIKPLKDSNETSSTRTNVSSSVINHSKANIVEMLRLLRNMIAKEFNFLDYTDITVTFTWGYHEPRDSDERLIIPSEENVILLNHSGSSVKINDLVKEATSLLHYMLVSGIDYKFYQHKSFAYEKGHYYWSSNEVRDKKKAEKTSNKEYGGSIFCYRIPLNGDGTTTNNYAVGFIMVSTGEQPITNTTHDEIRDQVKQSIKHMIDYRIKPQLLVEMAILYLSHLKHDITNTNYEKSELQKKIEEDYEQEHKEQEHKQRP